MDAPYWFPVLTLALGAVAGYLADYLREDRAASRAREQARRAFQRDTLIELQDSIADLARATGRGHHEDTMEYAKTGQWGRGAVSEEANEGSYVAIREIHRLRVRLADRELDEQCVGFIAHCVSIDLPAARHPGDDAQVKRLADSRSAELTDRFQALNEQLGETLRGYL